MGYADATFVNNPPEAPVPVTVSNGATAPVPVSAATLPLPAGASIEAGGNAELSRDMLAQILIELRTLNFMFKAAFDVDADLQDIRDEHTEDGTPYAT